MEHGQGAISGMLVCAPAGRLGGRLKSHNTPRLRHNLCLPIHACRNVRCTATRNGTQPRGWESVAQPRAARPIGDVRWEMSDRKREGQMYRPLHSPPSPTKAFRRPQQWWPPVWSRVQMASRGRLDST